MAHELYTRTNQKIYFAGLALDGWRKAEEGRVMNAPALVQAEREAALFHLYGALLGLCHEIAGFYGLPNAQAPRAETLLERAVLEQAPSPEMAELVEMAQQPESWLGQLLASYAQLFQPPQAPRKAKVDPSIPLIQARALDGEEPEQALSREELEAWRQQLKQLALRFRASLTES
jgi:hypothetical protein